MILKLKRTPGIYLVGFMGSGKTTIGALLASALGWSFVDIDDDIEAAAEMTIPEIFERQGEDVFRQAETQAIRKRVALIERGTPMVVALGGGASARQENFELLENNGVTIWLDCPLEIAKRRVARAENRPLARDAVRFERLYHERREAYGRADFRIEIRDDDAEACVGEILKLPIF